LQVLFYTFILFLLFIVFTKTADHSCCTKSNGNIPVTVARETRSPRVDRHWWIAAADPITMDSGSPLMDRLPLLADH
jgi:hypothetical protein